MILDPDDAHISLNEMKTFLGTLSSIRYSNLPANTNLHASEHRHLLIEACEDFYGWVDDRPHLERPLRDTLCWLLNCSNERLTQFLRTNRVPYRGSTAEFRRFLSMLWERVFANWRVSDFDEDAYTLRPE